MVGLLFAFGLFPVCCFCLLFLRARIDYLQGCCVGSLLFWLSCGFAGLMSCLAACVDTCFIAGWRFYLSWFCCLLILLSV